MQYDQSTSFARGPGGRLWEPPPAADPTDAEILLAALREEHGNLEGTRRFRELLAQTRRQSNGRH